MCEIRKQNPHKSRNNINIGVNKLILNEDEKSNRKENYDLLFKRKHNLHNKYELVHMSEINKWNQPFDGNLKKNCAIGE